MKIHLDTGINLYNNLNMRVRIYRFMNAHQDKTKKVIWV